VICARVGHGGLLGCAAHAADETLRAFEDAGMLAGS
jgi:hypothetical protein